MTENSQSLSDRDSAALWATPSWGDAPERLVHVKTTAKQVIVKSSESVAYTERYSRDGVLPEGAVGSKHGLTWESMRYLFADRVACLRFMAERAREQAQRAAKKAADLRARADAWDAEAAGAADEVTR